MATLTSQEQTGLGTTTPPLRLALRVFLLFSVIYLCTWAGHYTSGDGGHKLAWAKAMLFGQNSGVTPDQNGVYSKYGIGHSLLAMPPLEAAHLIQKTTGIRTEAALYTLIFVINGAFFLALVAYYLAHFYPSRAVWGTTLILGLGTIWWPYTKLDFSEPLVLTAVFLGFVLIRFGNPLLGLTIAALSMTIRPDAPIILAPLVLWYLLANRSMRAVLKVALAFAPSVVLVLFANYIRYHTLLDRGYSNEGFTNLFLVGLYGVLLSSGKSMFLYSPPLLLGIWGWKRFARREETKTDAWLFLAICIAQVLFYAKYCYWTSDEAWGDRYVLPGVMLLCISMVGVLHRKAVVIPVVAAGLFVQLLVVSVGGLDYWKLVWPGPQRVGVYIGGTNRLDFADVWFNPNYSPIYANWILLRYLLHVPPEDAKFDDAIRVGSRLEDVVPPQAWKATAHWDFIWIRGQSAAKANASDPAALTSGPPSKP